MSRSYPKVRLKELVKRKKKQLQKYSPEIPIRGLSVLKTFCESEPPGKDSIQIIGRNCISFNPIQHESFPCAYNEEFEVLQISNLYETLEVIDEKKLLVKYLWIIMQQEEFGLKIRWHATGGVRTEIKASDILKFEITLPPLSIQQEIVKRYEAIEKLIKFKRNMNKKLELLQERKFHQLFDDLESEEVKLEKLFSVTKKLEKWLK